MNEIMKKKKLTNGTFIRWILLLLMLVTGTTQGVAQNVTIDLVHGSLLAAVTDQNETGFGAGFKALWRHEQLALSMTGSDRDAITETGEIAEPSAVFGEKNGKITIVGGRRPSFIVVSLPKGYRITGYTLVLANDLRHGAYDGKFAYINTNNLQTGGDFSQDGRGEGTMRFYEVKKWQDNRTNAGHAQRAGSDNTGYDATDVRNIAWGTNYQNGQIGQEQSDMLAQALDANNNGDIKTTDAVGKEYTISRTSQSENDMGNQLYFRLVKNYYCYGLTIKSFEIRFTAEGTFEANVKPTEASNTAVSMDASPFKTNKIDIGEMTNNVQPGTNNSAFSYTWGNVTDLDAFNYIYQKDAHETDSDLGGEVPADVAETKKIYKVDNGGGNLYYGLKNDIYYVETPIQIKNKANKMVPIGYRIVGAQINYALGSEDYSIQLYDRAGAKITGADGLITVNESNATGSKDLGLLNNDAIKFEILGSGTDGAFTNTGGMALITVDLYLQALNPYIDKMDIVCHDNRDVLQLTQSFTADNFSVAGDKFVFYVPEDYGSEDLTFTFSGLYSKYGDETYYDGSGEGAARYSFVRSPYFIPVDGDGDKGLYDDAYRPDASYTNKVYTSNAGKYRFKFNNAEDLAAAGDQTHGYLTEYPFSVKTYLNTENPGDPTATPAIAPSSDKGTFIDCVLNASKSDQKSGTYYVFTADETRWNIAPTDGWQHRYYAFYRMEIELRAKTFTPKFDWEKIYTKTFYNDGTGDKEDSMWGLTLDVTDTDNTGQKVTGYLTYQEIIDNIKGREGVKFTQEEIDAAAVGDPAYGKTTDDWKITPITKRLDDTNTNAPASMKQLLYVDGTPLYAMLNSSDGTTYKYLQDLKNELNSNALVFLPENTTSTLENVAYKTASGTFSAGKDIVLIDKLPFYSPYDIQVDAANYAMYTRKVTNSAYADVQYATVFMPFTISLNEGLHTDTDYGTMKFLQMNGSNATSNKKFDYLGEVDVDAAFFAKTSDNKVKANTPYALQIVNKGKSNDSFTLRQYGSNIIATPKKDVLFSAEDITSTGTLKDKYGVSADYTFSHVGTYSGGKVAKEQKLFYFANNGFYSSVELKDKYKTVDIYPFRSVYQTSGTGSAKVGYLMLVEGENPNTATGITDVDKVFTGITTGKGFISITSDADTAYRIRTVSGQNIDALNLKAGESRTVYVPAGIYLVNGLKVLVK